MPTTLTKTATIINTVTVANAVGWTSVPSGTLAENLSTSGETVAQALWLNGSSLINTNRLQLSNFNFNLPSNANVISFEIMIRSNHDNITIAPSIVISDIGIYNSTSETYKDSTSFIFGGSDIPIIGSFIDVKRNEQNGTNINYLIGSGSNIINRWNSNNLILEFPINGQKDIGRDTFVRIDQVTFSVTYSLILSPTKPTISFDETVDPRFLVQSIIETRKIKNDFTFLSITSNNSISHTFTKWELKKDEEEKSSISFSTNDNGVIGAKHKFSNISVATKNKLGILLNRRFNWFVRFKQNNNNWSDWELLNLSGELRVLGTRYRNITTKTKSNGKITFNRDTKFKTHYTKKGATIKRVKFNRRPKKSKQFKNDFKVRYTKKGAIIE